MQQGLLDPASLASSATSSTGTASASGSFEDALADAQTGAADAGTQTGYGDPTAASGLEADSTSPAALAVYAAYAPALAAADDGSGEDSDSSSALSALSGLGSPLPAAGLDTASSPTSDLAFPGLTDVAGTSGYAGTGGSGLSGSAGQQVQAMTQMANSLVGKPYIFGGGHSGWGPQAGYDCSGFVSAVLHAGGYLSEPADTTTLPDQPGILSGPGQLVTIYDRAQPGENGHVIIEIDGQFYESGGEAGAWGGGGGVERIAQPSAAYLATFPNVLHPAGL